MAKYFYTDEKGTKHGPVNAQQLQALVDRGIVTQTTPLNTEGGHKGLAGQIPGINFNMSQDEQAQNRTYSQATLPTPWLFDLSFDNIQLPQINLLITKVLYTIAMCAAFLVLVFQR